MNPETRAARDRLARFAGSDFRMSEPRVALPVTHLTVGEAEHFVAQAVSGILETITPDIRVVLAALDQQPTGILTSDAIMSETEYEELRRRFLVQQQGTPRMRMANEALRCADAVEDLRDAARHGTDGPIRDWARHTLDNAGLAWRPQPKTDEDPMRAAPNEVMPPTRYRSPSIDPGMSILSPTPAERARKYFAEREHHQQHHDEPEER